MLRVVHERGEREAGPGLQVGLDELCRLAAQEMLALALEAERQAYLERYATALTEDGRRLVRGQRLRPSARDHDRRRPARGAGAARRRPPRRGALHLGVAAALHAELAEGERGVAAALPAGTLDGRLSARALVLLRLGGGLSASTVGRLTEAWQAEHKRWRQRSLGGVDYVYLWADGVHFNVRLEEDRLCCLVLVGVRPDGRKELVAVQDGYREDTQSWLDLLRELRERGMRDPELAVGDGALGFWAALREVFSRTREQRCWVHKSANVLAALPERVQGEAKQALQAVSGAATRAGALDAARAFCEQFAQWPKATAKVTDDLERLLAFHDFPAEHQVHLRTTNPIESTFATVRLRQRVTRARARAQRGWRWPTSCSTPRSSAGGV